MLALGCAGVLGWGGWAWLRVEQYHHALTEIRIDMAARRFAIAASKLEKLLAWQPNSDEAAYFLGVCELERGHSAAAAAAWANVKAGSAHSERAFVARMKLFYNSVQLSAAEQFIDEACRDPRNERTGVRVLLVPVYRELGRLDDAKRVRQLRAAISGLPRQQREVIELCVYSGLDQQAAALALGISVGTVKSRLHRARQRLADELRASQPGREEL